MQSMEVNLEDEDFKFAYFFNIDADMDTLNNPYVEIVGINWHISEGLQNYFELDYCSDEYLSDFIAPQMRTYYHKPICPKDKTNLYLNSNIYASIDSRYIGLWTMNCRNSTENGNWCKSKEETDNWLKTHSRGFLH